MLGPESSSSSTPSDPRGPDSYPPPACWRAIPTHRLCASVPSPSRALVCFSMGLENAVVSCMAPVLFQAVLPAFDFSYRVKQCLMEKCHSWLILLLALVESIRAEKGTDKGRHSRVPQKEFSGVFPTATCVIHTPG